MRRCTGIIMAFLCGAIAVRNLLESLIRSAFVEPEPATIAANTADAAANSTSVINSLEQRLHQLTEEFTRMNASFYETMQQKNKSQHQQLQLPQCDEVMQAPNSRFQDGSFLTSFTTPIQWTPRADGSRQVDLNNYICHLKRYTSAEAKTCLAKQHVTFIGDSLTRYQYLSLAYFLEHDTFPPRFGNFRQPCTHVNESGHQTCSPLDQPNICMETDWRLRIPKEFGTNDQWMYFFASLGGYSPSSLSSSASQHDSGGGGIMNGRMECSCARTAPMRTENQLYTNGKSQTVMSYFKEDGWGNAPNPLHGFYFTNCSQTGTCRQTYAENQHLVNRSIAIDFDWSQKFPAAINTSGVLRQHQVLPSQPNIVIYNRGHWGKLSTERTKTIMPVLYDWVHHHQKDTAANTDNSNHHSRCFFKSTTASSRSIHKNHFERELREVRPFVHEAGCNYLDYAHLTQPFAALPETKDWREKGERGATFWDAVHYMPWVYEELNQVLLNVLCNAQKFTVQS